METFKAFEDIPLTPHPTKILKTKKKLLFAHKKVFFLMYVCLAQVASKQTFEDATFYGRYNYLTAIKTKKKGFKKRPF